MTPIPQLPYELLYDERVIRSVTNNTRQDGQDFLEVAAEIPVRTQVWLARGKGIFSCQGTGGDLSMHGGMVGGGDWMGEFLDKLFVLFGNIYFGAV